MDQLAPASTSTLAVGDKITFRGNFAIAIELYLSFSAHYIIVIVVKAKFRELGTAAVIS